MPDRKGDGNVDKHIFFIKSLPKKMKSRACLLFGLNFSSCINLSLFFGNVQIVLARFSFDFVILNSYVPPKIPIFQETIHITIYFVLRVTVFDNYSRCRPDEI